MYRSGIYRSGTPLICTEVVHVPKWSKFRIWRKTCTEVVCTEMVMYRTGPNSDKQSECYYSMQEIVPYFKLPSHLFDKLEFTDFIKYDSKLLFHHNKKSSSYKVKIHLPFHSGTRWRQWTPSHGRRKYGTYCTAGWWCRRHGPDENEAGTSASSSISSVDMNHSSQFVVQRRTVSITLIERLIQWLIDKSST